MALPNLVSLRSLEPTENNINTIRKALESGARANSNHYRQHSALDPNILSYTDEVAKILREKIREGQAKGTYPQNDLSELRTMGVLHEHKERGTCENNQGAEHTVVQPPQDCTKQGNENHRAQPPPETAEERGIR